MFRLPISINSGEYARIDTPVKIRLNFPKLNKTPIIVVEVEGGREIACNFEYENKSECSVSWIIQKLLANEKKDYYLHLDFNRSSKQQNSKSSKVELVDLKGQRLDIRIDGLLFASYNYSKSLYKPYLYPVYGPSNKQITADKPADHLHHHSIWIGHADVNGVNFWSEGESSGRIVHDRFDKLISGPAAGHVTEINDWLRSDGRKILEEIRDIEIYNLPADRRIIDMQIRLKAGGEKVFLGSTKEMGFPHIRVAESMSVHSGGRIENSGGEINEREIFGKKAEWCDYSGPTAPDEWCGIAIFDHPENPFYPTRWFARDYGAFSPNFSNVLHRSRLMLRKYFSKPHIINPHQELKLAYRIYIHGGDAKKGEVKEKYADFSHPPKIERL